MQPCHIARRRFFTRRVTSLAVFAAILLGFASDGEACFWRRRCPCRQYQYQCVVARPCAPQAAPGLLVATPQYLASPQNAPAAAVAPQAAVPAPYVFVAP